MPTQILQDLQEMQTWASSFSRGLSHGDRVLLNGPLGSGKTTVIRMILQARGVDLGNTGSPTFPLVQVYQASAGTTFVHMDLYRLNKEEELWDAGLAEEFANPQSILFVEWSEKFPNFFKNANKNIQQLPYRYFNIELNFLPQSQGKFTDQNSARRMTWST